MRGTDMVVALGVIAIIVLVVRSAFTLMAKKIDAQHRPGLTSDAEQRIARIEQAVESIAIEVERISEGQRFTTRLLADRAAAPQSVQGSPPPARP